MNYIGKDQEAFEGGRRLLPTFRRACRFSIVGTLITENCEVPLETAAIIFSVAPAAPFAVWYASAGSSIVATSSRGLEVIAKYNLAVIAARRES